MNDEDDEIQTRLIIYSINNMGRDKVIPTPDNTIVCKSETSKESKQNGDKDSNYHGRSS